MSKELYYNKIKVFIYRKFEELEVVERNDGNTLYLRYDNEEYAQIVIEKKSGEVYYYYGFSNKITKQIFMVIRDFEILLKRWVENTFQMKVSRTASRGYHTMLRLKIPFK